MNAQSSFDLAVCYPEVEIYHFLEIYDFKEYFKYINDEISLNLSLFPISKGTPAKTSSKPSKMRFENCKTSTRKTENLAHLTYPHAESGMR